MQKSVRKLPSGAMFLHHLLNNAKKLSNTLIMKQKNKVRIMVIFTIIARCATALKGIPAPTGLELGIELRGGQPDANPLL